MGRGDYQYRLAESHSCTELGILARAYNIMTAQLAAHIAALHTAYGDLQRQTQALEASLRKVELLEQVQSHLGKFVPDSVRHLIEAAPEAPALAKRDRDVSVLFLDIAGYTRLSEQNSREKMNALVAAAGTDPIAINIGINSGIAAVGSTRFEGLTGERWTYTASGPVTNIAARLAELATQGEIYLGEETAARVKAFIPLKYLGTHQVKNVQEPIPVYQVRAAESPISCQHLPSPP